MYGLIHFVWESIEPWLYTHTLTVQIWIHVTNVPTTDSIHLVDICPLYSWCTDVQRILNGLYRCTVGWIAGSYGCTPVQQLKNPHWRYKCSMHRLNLFGGYSNPVQLMYGRIANFIYFELAMCAPINFVWERIDPWLFAHTLTVRTWINITNVQPTDSIHLVAIFIL